MAFFITNGILEKYLALEDETYITVPEGVREIADKAFANSYFLERVYLPEGLQRIGNKAFYRCWNIQEMHIPESLQSIGEEAFYYCENLKALDLPAQMQQIGTYAFSGCKKLKSLHLPDGLSYLDKGICCECDHLQSVRLPEGITNIGAYAFCKCRKLEQMIFPDSIREINAWAFYHCTALSSVKLPANLQSIRENAFAGCGERMEELCFPESLRRIGEYAFNACFRLRFRIPDGMETMQIKKHAFDSNQILHIRRNGRAVILSLWETWKWDKKGKLLASFLQKPSFETFAQIQNLDYQNALSVGYADIHPGIRTHLEQHIMEIMPKLIEEQEAETVARLLEDGTITSERIDELIALAIEQAQKGGSLEIQAMLMDYKATYFGFTDIADRLQL